MKEKIIALLKSRGFDFEEMAEMLRQLQLRYNPGLTHEACAEAISRVLDKREVQNAILCGISLDILAEEGKLDPDLTRLLKTDDPLFGIDENIGYAISTIYGTIGFTNYGYLDKTKPGLIGRLNDDKTHCNTFADDIAGAIIAAGAARLAHHQTEGENHQ
jgi:phosphatidylglycerophosphatase A